MAPMTDTATAGIPDVSKAEREQRKKSSGGIDFLAEHVERWPIRKLFANKRNAKRHSPDQIAQIAASIKQWGWTMPILVSDSGEIQAGEGRWRAAKLLDIEDVPVIVARGWSRNKRRAYMLADNRIAENGSWDKDALAIELGDLRDSGFEVSLTGFSKSQIENLLSDDDTDTGPQLADLNYQVIISCKDENEQRKMIARFEAEGLKCKVLIS
jgi:ParB-like chromosome segregation protein Spo0J